MLNRRQLLTIKHLQIHRKFTDPMQFIEWAIESLKKPWQLQTIIGEDGKRKIDKEHKLRRSQSRSHRSDKYYQNIIDYFAQGNPVPKITPGELNSLDGVRNQAESAKGQNG